ncbi:hypothetical protein Godav_006625 [Gossypium davidsonii]|uniref:Uncharacterized protein n=1 Tax=Gossypium davidsonii TaxID=34287 RepID=A0A7J8S5Z4_GOSDV|nr:hypothetical protein [Gossypium davidsonii]
MDLSTTQPKSSRNQDDSTFSKKKKEILMQVNKFLLHLLMLPRFWQKTYGPLELK